MTNSYERKIKISPKLHAAKTGAVGWNRFIEVDESKEYIPFEFMKECAGGNIIQLNLLKESIAWWSISSLLESKLLQLNNYPVRIFHASDYKDVFSLRMPNGLEWAKLTDTKIFRVVMMHVLDAYYIWYDLFLKLKFVNIWFELTFRLKFALLDIVQL